MKKWTPEQKQLAQTNINKVVKTSNDFLTTFNTEGVDDEAKVPLLLAIIESVEKDLEDIKNMLNKV